MSWTPETTHGGAAGEGDDTTTNIVVVVTLSSPSAASGLMIEGVTKIARSEHMAGTLSVTFYSDHSVALALLASRNTQKNGQYFEIQFIYFSGSIIPHELH